MNKFEQTARRDAEANEAWTRAGWQVVTVWEHESAVVAAARIAKLVGSRAK